MSVELHLLPELLVVLGLVALLSAVDRGFLLSVERLGGHFAHHLAVVVFEVPLIPEFRTLPEDVTCRGEVGVALNGVAIFSRKSPVNGVCQDFYTTDLTATDKCGGSSTSLGRYKYNILPTCLMNQMGWKNATHSPQVGWALDGFPMAQRGDADLALGWTTAASVIGGLFSVLVLIIAAPQLAAFSLNFTAIEYFALGIFALICIANVSRGAMAKGLLAGSIGLFLATIGVDHVTGDMRFTFGSFEMTAGISLIPVIVGLFALSEVFIRASESTVVKELVTHNVGFRLPPWSEWRPRLWLLFKSCTIGSFVGTLPGTGAATAAFIAYGEAKRSAPHKDKLGTGEPDGLVAAESANNAVTGSAIVSVPCDFVVSASISTSILEPVTEPPAVNS